jgi:hypothetical protein
VEVQLHKFLSSILGGERSTSRLDRITPGEKNSGIHRKAGEKGTRDDPEILEKKKKYLENFICM